MPDPANYIVYRDNPTSGAYHAVTATGASIASNATDPYPVLQAALDRPFWNDPASGPGPGHVYVQAGNYVLRPGFPGFDLRSYTRLTLDPTARLTVPNGYAGFVFRLRSTNSGSVVHAGLDGGEITEQGSPARRWTALLLQAAATNNAGILFNKISNTVVRNAGIGLRLWVSGNRDFINANRFEFLRMWSCGRFIFFEIDPPYQTGQQDIGIISNNFSQIECQANAALTVGIDAVAGAFNTFLDVKVWDVGNVTPGQKRAVLTSKAYRTRIIAGLMAGGRPGEFVDGGTQTQLVAAAF